MNKIYSLYNSIRHHPIDVKRNYEENEDGEVLGMIPINGLMGIFNESLLDTCCFGCKKNTNRGSFLKIL